MARSFYTIALTLAQLVYSSGQECDTATMLPLLVLLPQGFCQQTTLQMVGGLDPPSREVICSCLIPVNSAQVPACIIPSFNDIYTIREIHEKCANGTYTDSPTSLGSSAPSLSPSFIQVTASPTLLPSIGPASSIPTLTPTHSPTLSSPTTHPTSVPTLSAPTANPTQQPTHSNPTVFPSTSPATAIPTSTPSAPPSATQTQRPSTGSPSYLPTEAPATALPTKIPTISPSSLPPTSNPSFLPSFAPTQSTPTRTPSVSPTTLLPTSRPTTLSPTDSSQDAPVTTHPTIIPSTSPLTSTPSISPTTVPTYSIPTSSPTDSPSVSPSALPQPTVIPSAAPLTSLPSNLPSNMPTLPVPTSEPSKVPTTEAPLSPATTFQPTHIPSVDPSTQIPSLSPTLTPSHQLTTAPTMQPTLLPTRLPTHSPTVEVPLRPATFQPTHIPSVHPSTQIQSLSPSLAPSHQLTTTPTSTPTYSPTRSPSQLVSVFISEVHTGQGSYSNHSEEKLRYAGSASRCNTWNNCTLPGQFIELYNPGNVNVNLTNWVVNILLFQPAVSTTFAPIQQAVLSGMLGAGAVFTVCLGLSDTEDISYCCCDNTDIVGRIAQFDPTSSVESSSHLDRIYLMNDLAETIDTFGPQISDDFESIPVCPGYEASSASLIHFHSHFGGFVRHRSVITGNSTVWGAGEQTAASVNDRNSATDCLWTFPGPQYPERPFPQSITSWRHSSLGSHDCLLPDGGHVTDPSESSPPSISSPTQAPTLYPTKIPTRQPFTMSPSQQPSTLQCHTNATTQVIVTSDTNPMLGLHLDVSLLFTSTTIEDKRWDTVSPKQSYLRSDSEASPIPGASKLNVYENRLQGFGRSVAVSQDGSTIAVGASDGLNEQMFGGNSDDYLSFTEDWANEDDRRGRCWRSAISENASESDARCLFYRDSMYIQILRTCTEDVSEVMRQNSHVYGSDVLIGRTGCMSPVPDRLLGRSLAGEACVADYTQIHYRKIENEYPFDSALYPPESEEPCPIDGHVRYKMYRNFCENMCSVGIFYGQHSVHNEIQLTNQQIGVRSNEYVSQELTHLGRSVVLNDNGTLVAFADIGAGIVQVWKNSIGDTNCQVSRLGRRVSTYNLNEDELSCWEQLGTNIMDPSLPDGRFVRRQKTRRNLSYFGESLDMSSDGTILVVGSRRHNISKGRVDIYVLDIESGDWISQTPQGITGLEPGSAFGSAISISDSGRFVAIGAPGNPLDTTSDVAPYVRVFTRATSDEWAPYGDPLYNSDTSSAFGKSVSVFEDTSVTVAVGVPYGIGPQEEATGLVQVFSFNDRCQEWAQLGPTIVGSNANSLFGASIALSESLTPHVEGNVSQLVLAIGAPSSDIAISGQAASEDTIIERAGQAFVFMWDTASKQWRQINFANRDVGSYPFDYVNDTNDDASMALRVPQILRNMFDDGEITSGLISATSGGFVKSIEWPENYWNGGFGSAIALSRGNRNGMPLRLVSSAPQFGCASSSVNNSNWETTFPCRYGGTGKVFVYSFSAYSPSLSIGAGTSSDDDYFGLSTIEFGLLSAAIVLVIISCGVIFCNTNKERHQGANIKSVTINTGYSKSPDMAESQL